MESILTRSIPIRSTQVTVQMHRHKVIAYIVKYLVGLPYTLHVHVGAKFYPEFNFLLVLKIMTA